MFIERNGMPIELTADELFKAYEEQEFLFDVQNIKENMSCELDEDEYDALVDNQEFIEAAAVELRCNQDKYGMDYSEALSDAFDKAKNKFLK